MSRNQDEYKEWQNRYDDLEAEWKKDSGGWSDGMKRDHLENMKDAHDLEYQGREETRDEWDEDGNQGQDDRIESLWGRGQLLNHDIAHADGEYEYQTEGMQDMDEDLRRELERENDEANAIRRSELISRLGSDSDEKVHEQEDEDSDMDIDSGSDSNSEDD